MDENKKKFALWVHPSTIDKVERLYQLDNCQSRSEFIEKAILFTLVMFQPRMAVIISQRLSSVHFKVRLTLLKTEWLR